MICYLNFLKNLINPTQSPDTNIPTRNQPKQHPKPNQTRGSNKTSSINDAAKTRSHGEQVARDAGESLTQEEAHAN